MKRITVLCSLYPNSINASGQVFIQQFVWSLADMGIKCVVICPVAINQYPELRTLPESTLEKSPNGFDIQVFFPKFLSAGQKNFLGIKTARITSFFYHRAVLRIWKRYLVEKPDAIYGHFFTPAGICAARIGKEFGISTFVAYGESSPWSITNFGTKRIKKEVNNISGVISVSTANKIDLEKFNLIDNKKIKVFPNGIRTNHFFPRNRVEARRKFGFPKDVFIIAFTGHFSERKGVLRLRDAVDGLDGIFVIYGGTGKLVPESNNTLFKGLVNPEDMPHFLSSADLYVLPTLNEGCSNAIVEAVACGLPIISSDLPFNYDILDESNSILVDPKNVKSIRSAIKKLRDNRLLSISLGKGSLKKAEQLSLNARANNIKNWMEQIINDR
jgi:teichuronic acid biosynthesis glycosyltransferase TuaC